METRRAFLKKAIFLSGAAGFSGALPASIQRALAIDPKPGSTWMDAEHVVILMQENRSFDHCFGSLQGVRGFQDPRAIKLSDGNSVWLQTNAAGETYAPFRLNIKDTRATWMNCLPHSRPSQVDAWNGGKQDGWLEAKRSPVPAYANLPLTMGHYTREDIPFNYALADAFTICDQNFCGAMTCTFPNRLLFWTGTIRDEQNEQAKANIRNQDLRFGKSRWGTFPELLQQNNVSWKFYQNDVSSLGDASCFGDFTTEQVAWLGNFGCNPLEYFAQYHVKFSPQYMSSLPKRIDRIAAEIQELEAHAGTASLAPARREALRVELEGKRKSLDELREDLEKGLDAFERLPEAAKDLHRRAFATNEADPDYRELAPLSYHDGTVLRQVNVPKGDVLYQFRADVRAGTLPTISWLTAPQNFSDHPSAPWYGAWYVSEVMDILTQDPEVWKKTIFILTYDENDGYFDHVPPFVAPDPRRPETGRVSAGIDSGLEFIRFEQEVREGVPPAEAREGPIGLGFRVPLIVASPWSRGGWVNSQVFDATSTLQFLEKFLSGKLGRKIEESNISRWRRTVSGDLTTVFRPFQKKNDAALSFVKRDPLIETIYNAKFKKLPDDYEKLSEAEIESVNRNPQASSLLPGQEKGLRRSCALPYQLYAVGALTPDRQSFAIQLRAADEAFGEQAKGSPFNIYAYNLSMKESGKTAGNERGNGIVRCSSYAVSAGDDLRDSWPLDAFADRAYHLCVHGPNGFFREFKGEAGDPEVTVSCEYQAEATDSRRLTGNIEVKVTHTMPNAHCAIEIIDYAYKAKPIRKKLKKARGGKPEEASIVLKLEKNFGWYDFGVHVAGFPHCERRYAGRVETGRWSHSDPAMGGVLL